jgi:hypothetical protein
MPQVGIIEHGRICCCTVECNTRWAHHGLVQGWRNKARSDWAMRKKGNRSPAEPVVTKTKSVSMLAPFRKQAVYEPRNGQAATCVKQLALAIRCASSKTWCRSARHAA